MIKLAKIMPLDEWMAGPCYLGALLGWQENIFGYYFTLTACINKTFYFFLI